MALAFDTLDYTKGAEAVGIKREHAEYQAQQIARLVDNSLATKNDLIKTETALRNDLAKTETALRGEIAKVEIEIKSLEIRLIKWVIGVSFAQAGLILGILGFLLKHSGV